MHARVHMHMHPHSHVPQGKSSKTSRLLRRGDGLLKMPEARVNKRVFGESGSGPSTLPHAGVKLELVGSEMIPPREDTCLAAFVRLLLRSNLDPYARKSVVAMIPHDPPDIWDALGV